MRWTVEGEWPSIDEQRALRLALVQSGQLTAATRALIDLRMAANIPQYDELGATVRAALRDGGLPSRRAYLVGSAAQHGLVRQLQALAEGSAVTIAIFSNEAEALLWLQK